MATPRHPKVKVILASTSPRRIELLSKAGVKVAVQSPDADEKRLRGEAPREMVARLSLDKALSVARKLGPGKNADSVIVAADTIVVAPDGKTVLGKPRNEREARSMLSRLSGRTHTVLTGYCLMGTGKGEKMGRFHVRVIRSRVRMRKLSPKQIAAYVSTGEPMDKAGSYAAQGIGMALIERIGGSYSNVVGLPMCEVMEDLEKHYGIGIFGWNR